MRITVDSDTAARGGSGIVEMATTLRGLIEQSGRTQEDLAGSTGSDDLRRDLAMSIAAQVHDDVEDCQEPTPGEETDA